MTLGSNGSVVHSLCFGFVDWEAKTAFTTESVLGTRWDSGKAKSKMKYLIIELRIQGSES